MNPINRENMAYQLYFSALEELLKMSRKVADLPQLPGGWIDAKTETVRKWREAIAAAESAESRLAALEQP